MGKVTTNEKQLELVGQNFILALDENEAENRFVEYMFNRFSSDWNNQTIHTFNEQIDNMAYDKKKYRVRKLNPDENKYYIHAVRSFRELYLRKKTLNQAIDTNTKRLKLVQEKMSKISGTLATDSI
jgi:hypothetical protein